jgi:hypothetical protein
MTYKDRFVAEVKHNGRILRVRDGFVTLPFGSEYSLLFKNMNSRRAAVTISIDGQDVLDGQSLVVNPNQTVELMGFMRGSSVRNRFRFIKKTKEIMNHRGDRIDDGMIRIEFAYEKPAPKIRKVIDEHHYHYHYYNDPWKLSRTIYDSSPQWTYSNNAGGIAGNAQSNGFTNTNFSNAALNDVSACNAPENVMQSVNKEDLQTPLEDMGITVKGSETYQGFYNVTMGDTDEAEVIIINLKGTDSQGQVVQQPITTRDKLTCSSCGRKSSSNYKFCPNCGTYLE